MGVVGEEMVAKLIVNAGSKEKVLSHIRVHMVVFLVVELNIIGELVTKSFAETVADTNNFFDGFFVVRCNETVEPESHYIDEKTYLLENKNHSVQVYFHLLGRWFNRCFRRGLIGIQQVFFD